MEADMTPNLETLIADRRITYGEISTQLALLNDRRLSELLEKATPLHVGIGGTSAYMEVCDTPIFVKKIPLTDLERRPEHFLSTANIFELPLYYQYGIGSAGFGAWRDLAAHVMTTNWVLADECPNFPLMYHWRILPTAQPEPMNAEQLEALEKDVTYWEGSPAVRARLKAIHNASAETVIFSEYFPENLRKWFSNQMTKGGDVADAAITMVEHDLRASTSFMKERGLLHFDAHFANIVTDGHRLYFADFGLALCSRFELSDAERAFFEQHRNYDQYYTAGALVGQIGTHFFGKDLEAKMHEYAAGEGAELESPLATQILKHDADKWIIMNDLMTNLRKDKTTPYPAQELES